MEEQLAMIVSATALKMVTAAIIFLFSIIMCFAHFVAKNGSKYYIYYGLFLLSTLPIAVFNSYFSQNYLAFLSNTPMVTFSLGMSPLLFFCFFHSFFDIKTPSRNVIIGGGILWTVIQLAFTMLTAGLSAVNIQKIFLAQSVTGTFVSFLILFIGIWKLTNLKRKLTKNGINVLKIFLGLMLPFCAGKLIENAMFETFLNTPTDLTLGHIFQYSQIHVLTHIPLMLGLLGFRYIYEQQKQKNHDAYRIKIHEVLTQSSKAIPKEVLCKTILEIICEMSSAERGSIALKDKDGIIRVKSFFGVGKINVYNEEFTQDPKFKRLLDRNKNISLKSRSNQTYFINLNNTTFETRCAMIFHLQTGSKNYGQVLLADNKGKDYFTPTDFEAIEMMIPSITAYLENRELFETLNEQYDGVVTAFAETINSKDPYTKFHCVGVTTSLAFICQELDFPLTRELKTAALLHDLGKTMIDAYILGKPGRLNKDEEKIIRSHPMHSGQILERIPGFENIAKWASLHHEFYDGTGYPFGLKGDHIPIEAQLINAADFLDAVSTNRTYNARMSFENIEKIVDQKKEKYNPKVYQALKVVIQLDAFQSHYELKSLKFKIPTTAEDVKLKYVIDRLEQVTTSLRSAYDIVAVGKRLKRDNRPPIFPYPSSHSAPDFLCLFSPK